jgi:hypothetical protein
MSEPGTSISEKEFSKWPLLSAVLAKVTPRLGHDAHQKVVMRLSKGLLVARAEDSFLAERSGTKIVLPERSMVTKAVWKRVKLTDYQTRDSLWETSTVIETIGRRSNGGGVRYEHFGVRVDPAGVAKMLPEVLPKVPRPPARLPRPARSVNKPLVVEMNVRGDEPPQKGPPPLSPMALKLWYEAYKAGYEESEWSLDHAWSRAQLAFPDKSVTRKSVQDLMPAELETKN